MRQSLNLMASHYKRGTIPHLEQLPADQMTALIRWLTDERLTYGKAKDRLKVEFGVKTSPAALSGFWHDVCVPRQMIESARKTAAGGRLLLEVQVRLTGDGAISLTVTTPEGSKEVAVNAAGSKA